MRTDRTKLERDDLKSAICSSKLILISLFDFNLSFAFNFDIDVGFKKIRQRISFVRNHEN